MAVSHTPTISEEALKGRMIIKDSCLTSDFQLWLQCVSICPVDCAVLDHLGRCSQLTNRTLERELRHTVPSPFAVSRTDRSLYFERSHLFNYLVKFFSRGMVFGSAVWQWTETRLEKMLVTSEPSQSGPGFLLVLFPSACFCDFWHSPADLFKTITLCILF